MVTDGVHLLPLSVGEAGEQPQKAEGVILHMNEVVRYSHYRVNKKATENSKN